MSREEQTLRRTTNGAGYIRLFIPEHHRANARGFVYEHLVVAEEKLARPLAAEEFVRHINGNPSDNHPDNLRVLRKHNSERIRARNRAATKRYKESPKGRRTAKAGNLRKLYGMTIEGYETLLRAQRGTCAICKCAPPPGRSLQVDHCHETKKVRGLLCGSCNKGLGMFADEPSLFERAAVYLNRARGDYN